MRRGDPAWDEFGGLRVHAWVLVVAGKRDVPETFFIEPTTGHALSPLDPAYLGVEAAWNSRNFWVNMQPCTNGLGDMQYDMGDTSCWEYVFPDEGQSATGVAITTGGDVAEARRLAQQQGEIPGATGLLDLPPSWVLPLSLTPKEFETRCPRGRRTFVDGCTQVEVYAPYLREDGLVRLASEFSDADMMTLVQETFTYAHRKDHLVRKVEKAPIGDKVGTVVEYTYLPGHPQNLRCMRVRQPTYSRLHEGTTTEYIYYSAARADGLEQRESAHAHVKEWYKDREDSLRYRQVSFFSEMRSPSSRRRSSVAVARRRSSNFGGGGGGRGSMSGGLSSSDRKQDGTEVDFIVERYDRHPGVPAAENAREITYFDDLIQVEFHREKGSIAGDLRDFFKPQLDEKQHKPPITKDMVQSFAADPLQRPDRNFELQSMLDRYLVAEAKCKAAVADSRAECSAIAKHLRTCENRVELSISFYDTTRNEHIKERRAVAEREGAEARARQERMERDYLSPFLVQLDDPENLTEEDAVWLVDQAKKDLRERLVHKADLIKQWFDKEQAELQQRQSWFQQNQGQLTSEQEEEYVSFCSETLFRIKVLEKRMNLLKETAPQKLVKLDNKLSSDPRLAPLLP